MTAQETNGANFFETTLSAAMGPTDLTANVLTTTGLTVPCYMVLEPDVAARREVWLVDGSLTATTLVASNINKRYLTGSAAGSGITHPINSKVRFAAVWQQFEDINDRVDAMVAKSLFDANTILIATADNTPLALPVAASRVLGRKATGDIDDMTTAELAALFGTPDGAKFLADDGTLKTPSSGSYVGARAYRTTTQSFSTTTWTALALTTESFDTGTIHDTGSNTDRFVAPSAGKYLAIAYVDVSSATGCQLRFYKNGSDPTAGLHDTHQARTGGANVQIQVVGVYDLATNDYLSAYMWSDHATPECFGGAMSFSKIG